MRSLLLALGIVSLLVRANLGRGAEDAADDSPSSFRTVLQPGDVFEVPNPNLAEPPPPPIPVPPAPAAETDEDGGTVVIPPEAATLEAPKVLEGPAEPRPFNFELTGRGITWLPGDGDRLGMLSFSGPGTVSFSSPQELTGTLGIGFHFLDGPHRTDLPSRLFEFSFGVGWRDQVDDEWAYEVNVSPGVYADFEGSAREGVRILGHGIVWYESSPDSLWALGVASLDRETISVLPVVGVVHRPDERTRLELLFPRPKFARKLGVDSDGDENWLYVAGEYGGGSWAIERYTDEEDVLTLNDLRLIVGIEWFTEENGPGGCAEIGWVFDREVRYQSGRGDYNPPDTLMLRLGNRF